LKTHGRTRSSTLPDFQLPPPAIPESSIYSQSSERSKVYVQVPKQPAPAPTRPHENSRVSANNGPIALGHLNTPRPPYPVPPRDAELPDAADRQLYGVREMAEDTSSSAAGLWGVESGAMKGQANLTDEPYSEIKDTTGLWRPAASPRLQSGNTTASHNASRNNHPEFRTIFDAIRSHPGRWSFPRYSGSWRPANLEEDSGDVGEPHTLSSQNTKVDRVSTAVPTWSHGRTVADEPGSKQRQMQPSIATASLGDQGRPPNNQFQQAGLGDKHIDNNLVCPGMI
jgi:hypothetical protein